MFQAAEALDVVLFFDEADALFGSRSDVHDARDRYANQEVAYLLQRIEHFDGITILSTNLRGNLDRAFSRRMNFIVHFPDPDVPTRARLWEHHLAQLSALDPKDPVDVDYLAASAELAGGDIRNIVLAATYDAASADVAVGHAAHRRGDRARVPQARSGGARARFLRHRAATDIRDETDSKRILIPGCRVERAEADPNVRGSFDPANVEYFGQ